MAWPPPLRTTREHKWSTGCWPDPLRARRDASMIDSQARDKDRPTRWKWWVCGLLLLASAINYMDRQTLANASPRITGEFGLSQEEYGNFEFAFGWAFAVGSIFFGVLADKIAVRWLYPVVLFLWSGAGFATA